MIFFKREKLPNGKRKIYLFGKKIFSYKSVNKHYAVDNIKYYQSLGVKIGKGTTFIVHPKKDDHPDFGSEPFLIEIGNDCLISFGVTFLTHDGSRQICLNYIDKAKRNSIITWKKIKIGNNVFIGCHSIIMPGVSIGNNVVIGAGSVVTKDIPDGEVWAGNPARFIQSTKELAKKHENFSKSDYTQNIRNEFADKLKLINKN